MGLNFVKYQPILKFFSVSESRENLYNAVTKNNTTL